MRIGCLAAAILGRTLSALEISPADPAVLLTTGMLLSGAALLARYLQARRAARVDPSLALSSK